MDSDENWHWEDCEDHDEGCEDHVDEDLGHVSQDENPYREGP